jgi:hypothetical protein
MPSCPRFAASVAVVAALLLPAAVPRADDPARPGDEQRPVSIRIRWGGGTPRAWSGRIALFDKTPAAGPGPTADAAPVPFSWKTLGTEPDAAATAHDDAGGIAVHQPRPLAGDGIELTVADWQRARLSVGLGPGPTGETAAALDLPLSEILAAPVQRQLDADGNRLTVETAPGDALRVTLTPGPNATGRPADTAVRRPGDVLRFRVDPLLAIKPGEGQFELRLRLTGPQDEKPIDGQTAPLTPRTAAPAGGPFASGRVPVEFNGVDFELSLPEAEGVYEITLEAVERGGLRWTRPLATRTLQVVALADAAAERPATAEWTIVYELDPGSPKLHERLRRLPGRGLPSVPVPTIPLPAMPLPSLSRARVPLPRLPEMTGLPEVPIPSVSAMVPRLSGLLATGHSLVVPHALGPMLRLPAAPRPTEPSWEGIVIAGAQPGRPHVVEIDHPRLQRATVVAGVLEPDATATMTELRHAGGFAVIPPPDLRTDSLDTHRFVFWPTTRNPLVVIANPSGDHPALVGRVRILAGPEHLPPAARPTPAPLATSAPGRASFAVFDAPDLHRLHGGAGRVAATGGRPFADWTTHLTGIRHSAEALAAGGLAGGVITVYADGAAIWPSRLTRQAARWDPAAVGEAGLDPLPKDVLGAVATIYGREGLKVVPAFAFNAAIPALEAELVGDTATGITCLGGDGRPRRIPGGLHYNILDPRVQAAVEQVVAEAAERLAGGSAIAGLALMLPHDGWLHLPGVAWGLDDVTFGRFSQTIGGSHVATGPERFAERARLVEGPLRQEWLAWRTGELTGFYARLTARVAAIDPRWPVYLVPTTLVAAGEIAERFQPSLDEGTAAPDLLREIGLVAGLPAAAGDRLVFMAPHVHAPGTGLRNMATVAEASRALALAETGALPVRRGAVIVTRPLPVDLSDVASQGPFGTATPPGPCGITFVTDDEAGDRGLAETLVAADAEVVFDMRTAVTLPDQVLAARHSFESLPAGPMKLATGLPAPVVVRTAAAGGMTRIAVVNAGPAAAVAVLKLGGPVSAAIDATDGAALPLGSGPSVAVPLPAWGLRSLVIDGGVGVDGVTVAYDDAVRADVARRIERLRQRLAVLEAPAPLDVLDNPGFELGIGEAAAGEPAVTGWELMEPRRGSLELVAGLRSPEQAVAGGPGRGLSFASRNGLSTLRSNPFPPPTTGRISVAAWLRIAPDDPQPPLRIAIEAVESGREYYRFAAVGGLTGGRALTTEWSLFVLQVDDLPSAAIESLRVRFDLLGPGGVHIDDVRVFDLAFDAAQRGRLAKRIAALSHRFSQGDVGAALAGLDGHWPEFLETFVTDEKLAAVARRAPEPASPTPPAEPRQGMVDRLRGWWQ